MKLGGFHNETLKSSFFKKLLIKYLKDHEIGEKELNRSFPNFASKTERI